MVVGVRRALIKPRRGLKIAFLWQANALAAPQSFKDAISAAARMVENACPKTQATVYISLEYGTLNTVPVTGGQSASLSSFSTQTYTNLKAAMGANAKTATMRSLFASLGAGSSYAGLTNWFPGTACAKALGLIDPNLFAQDGAMGFATDVSTSRLIGAALHEIRQAMGGVRGGGTMQDLSTFTSAGNLTTNDATSAYFSVDGGVTNLANWSTTSDSSDFLTGGAHEALSGQDPFDAFPSADQQQSLTALDIINLNSLGFQ